MVIATVAVAAIEVEAVWRAALVFEVSTAIVLELVVEDGMWQAALVFEMQQSAIDRGADLGWLSQCARFYATVATRVQLTTCNSKSSTTTRTRECCYYYYECCTGVALAVCVLHLSAGVRLRLRDGYRPRASWPPMAQSPPSVPLLLVGIGPVVAMG